jgi:hypothetical protein
MCVHMCVCPKSDFAGKLDSCAGGHTHDKDAGGTCTHLRHDGGDDLDDLANAAPRPVDDAVRPAHAQRVHAREQAHDMVVEALHVVVARCQHVKELRLRKEVESWERLRAPHVASWYRVGVGSARED